MHPVLEDAGVNGLRLLWIDAGGCRRCRVLPRSAFSDASLKRGVGLTQGSMAMPSHADGVAPNSGLAPVGEVRLTPDLATIVTLPWCSHAAALCDMMDVSGEPWELCPRRTLAQLERQLLEQFDLELRVGFELEFYLLRSLPAAASATLPVALGAPSLGSPSTEASLHAAGWQLLDTSNYSSSGSADANSAVLDDIVVALEALSIPVCQFHAESGPGQFEVALGCFPALEAADKLLLAREAVCGVARVHGLGASFAPKPLQGHAGSGCHCHFSLWRDGINVMAASDPDPDGGTDHPVPLLLPKAHAALSAVLTHLPALLPFTAPSPNSYERLAPSCWAGAFRVWGWDNREAPLRLTAPPGGPDAVNAEFKAFDGSTNPYIALSALMAIMLHGLQNPSLLPPPVQTDPATLSKEHQGQPLPRSLQEALCAYEEDAEARDVLTRALGAPLIKALLAVRASEAEHGRMELSRLLFRY